MARQLIVEPNTERLQVVLMRNCSAVDAANVTLTVTRKRETVYFPVLHYADACLPPCRLCMVRRRSSHRLPRRPTQRHLSCAASRPSPSTMT